MWCLMILSFRMIVNQHALWMGGSVLGVNNLRRRVLVDQIPIGVVPANSVNEVSPRRGRKEYAGHSSEPAAQVGVDFFPRDRATDVLVEARKTPVKLGLLRWGQLHIRRGQAVPKLPDEVEPFFRGQAADVERCHVVRVHSVCEGFARRKGRSLRHPCFIFEPVQATLAETACRPNYTYAARLWHATTLHPPRSTD